MAASLNNVDVWWDSLSHLQKQEVRLIIGMANDVTEQTALEIRKSPRGFTVELVDRLPVELEEEWGEE